MTDRTRPLGASHREHPVNFRFTLDTIVNALFTLVYGLRVLPVLVFDFDGTVCLGDGPVRAYAEEAVRGLADDVATAVLNGLAAHLDGAPDGHPDGYSAVAALAAPYVTPDDLQ